VALVYLGGAGVAAAETGIVQGVVGEVVEVLLA
jgi:hypothetical protein